MTGDVVSATPRVLLVDDNASMLARAAALLSRSCAVVGTANDGASALEAAERLSPDVIVLDLSMPDMSGFEVAASLRSAGSRAAVVFLTVHEEEDFLTVAKETGALGYVVKSRMAQDLGEAVREIHAGRSFVSPRR